MNINQQLKENRVLPLATITSKEEVDGISHAWLIPSTSSFEVIVAKGNTRFSFNC